MFKNIKKRNGKVVKFEVERNYRGYYQGRPRYRGEFDDGKAAEKLTLKVVSLMQELIKKRMPTVEEVQDIVEEVLLSSSYRKTAKSYIIYRQQHAQLREITNKSSVNLVDQYLDQLDWQVNENSNMTFSLQGLNNYISSEISKVYWLNKIYPPRN